MKTKITLLIFISLLSCWAATSCSIIPSNEELGLGDTDPEGLGGGRSTMNLPVDSLDYK